jgi:hypothetical protein
MRSEANAARSRARQSKGSAARGEAKAARSRARPSKSNAWRREGKEKLRFALRRHGEGLAFVVGPGDDSRLFARHDPPAADVEAIHVSVTFTWDLDRARRLAAAWSALYPDAALLIGGPAFHSPCDTFTPGMYVKAGITYTSRGCDGRCPWCQVRDIEGAHRVIEDFAPGWVVADNDFLGCPWAHRKRVYEMLRSQPKGVQFRGGLTASKLTTRDAEQIRGLNIGKDGLWFACDEKSALTALEYAKSLLGPFSRDKLRCYMLVGYFDDDTPSAANARAMEVWRLGFIPFMQFYRGPAEPKRRRWSDEWAIVCRRWARPALSRRYMRDQADARSCGPVHA